MRLVNTELLREYSEDYQKSVIVLAIHQGNWEWMLHGATSTLDIPIDPVYKPLHNQAVDKMIFDTRSRFGSRPLSMEQSTRDILRRRKEFRIFVMVAEQSPTRHDRGYWTHFLGREAAFFLGAEVIAKMTGFPVLFVQCHRRGRGYYDMEFHEVARPPYDKDSHAITERYIELAEQSDLRRSRGLAVEQPALETGPRGRRSPGCGGDGQRGGPTGDRAVGNRRERRRLSHNSSQPKPSL